MIINHLFPPYYCVHRCCTKKRSFSILPGFSVYENRKPRTPNKRSATLAWSRVFNTESLAREGTAVETGASETRQHRRRPHSEVHREALESMSTDALHMRDIKEGITAVLARLRDGTGLTGMPEEDDQQSEVSYACVYYIAYNPAFFHKFFNVTRMVLTYHIEKIWSDASMGMCYLCPPQLVVLPHHILQRSSLLQRAHATTHCLWYVRRRKGGMVLLPSPPWTCMDVRTIFINCA